MDEQRLQRIQELTVKYVNGSITSAEQTELDAWLDADTVNRQRFEQRINEENTWATLAAMEEGEQLTAAWGPLSNYIDQDLSESQPKTRTLWRWAVASAAVLFIVAGGILYLKSSRQDAPVIASIPKPATLSPGGNRAILQLADGSRVDLGAAGTGTLATQGNVHVIKLDSGSLSYVSQQSANASSEATYNTVFTPRGGTYQIILPDHTTVWLNAESSLRFPTSFNARREVEVTGEAFFDVTKNKSIPFFVRSGKMNIQVLGTRFNINSYADEKSARATLVDGSVALHAGLNTEVLKPGEEATVDQTIKIKKVDIDEATAWKDGYFLFNGADIQTVMRQIGRWYNVAIAFEGKPTATRLSARVSRKKNANDVLEILQASGYHFRIADDASKITVLP
jgi:transmembrane sensor